MNLLWKLLRKHVSYVSFFGFFVANLLGMTIILLSMQFFRDVKTLFSDEHGVFRSDYMILHKGGDGLSRNTSQKGFTTEEIQELSEEPFCKHLGSFASSHYRVYCSLNIQGMGNMGTEMFFESVPDRFVQVDSSRWTFDPSHPSIPIVLPRSYLSVYNFGFAQSQSLPQLTEGVVGMMELTVTLHGNGLTERFPAKVVGFSSRLNTILVPESFLEWSNGRYASDVPDAVSRLIIELKDGVDKDVLTYFDSHGYGMEEENRQQARTTYFLNLVSGIVFSIGALICILSLFVLLLSIYLLVEKNLEKFRVLLLIGYHPFRISLPYIGLAVGTCAVVLICALMIMAICRDCYMDMIWQMFPYAQGTSLVPTILCGLCIWLVTAMLDVSAIYRRVMKLWNRMD